MGKEKVSLRVSGSAAYDLRSCQQSCLFTMETREVEKAGLKTEKRMKQTSNKRARQGTEADLTTFRFPSIPNTQLNPPS